MLLCLTLALSAALPATTQRPPAKAPAVQDTRARAEALAQALKDRDAQVRLAALRDVVGISDARGVALVVKALRDKDRSVRAAAIEALRFSSHAKALIGLHKMARSKAHLRDDPQTHAALLRAIGQHGSTSSLPILTSELLVQKDRQVSRAGILSLANIRSKKSVSELFSLMRSASRRQVQGHMTDLRLALVVLTGADQGLSQDAWNTWWNDEKRTLEVQRDLPLMSPKDRGQWEAHWGIQRRQQRALRRHERGSGDPE